MLEISLNTYNMEVKSNIIFMMKRTIFTVSLNISKSCVCFISIGKNDNLNLTV